MTQTNKRQQSSSDYILSGYTANAGDNSVSRAQINASQISPAVTNEASYVQALNRGLQDITDDTKS
jgi:hypothetical protein